MRDVCQAQMTAREMVTDLLDSDAVEELAEGDSVAFQAALKSPDVGAKRVCDLSNRSAAHWHQDPDRLLDFLGDRSIARCQHSADKFARMRSKGHVRHRVAALHVGTVDHDSVEIGTELQRAVEQPIIKWAV